MNIGICNANYGSTAILFFMRLKNMWHLLVDCAQVLPNMDQMDQDEAHNNLNLTEGELREPKNLNRWAKTQNEDKRASVHDEIARVNQLPSNSSYAVHRMRVLNKLLHLMSIQVRKKISFFILNTIFLWCINNQISNLFMSILFYH